MEKVTLKYDSPQNKEYGSPANLTLEMSFDTEGMTLSEFAGYVRKFAIAIGYLPETVMRVFPEEE